MPDFPYGLGRWSWGDERDLGHLMSSKAFTSVTAAPRTAQIWRPGVVLDQGQTPQCVAYAWKGLLQASPYRQGRRMSEAFVYEWAQQHDEWPGEAYEGTSVRAGAKFLQGLGFLAEYVWCFDAASLKNWILRRGPAVLGTAWFDGMFTPTDGLVVPSGELVGGHAYLCVGYSGEQFQFVNSWGEGWGDDGEFSMAEAHVDWLLKNHGEACAPAEQVI